MVGKTITDRMKGYVRICIEGYFVERFMNICRVNHILLWNVKKENASIIHANIGIKEFKEIRKIAKKTKCKVKIEKKRGVPFFLYRYQKRKLFLFFLILILFLILLLSNFVWHIEIKGIENLKQEEILSLAEQNGLEVGKWKHSLDTKKIVNDIRLNCHELAWVGIEIKGTNAIIEVVEADKKPEIIPENEYCNIVSDKAGMVLKVEAANGTALVNPGDVVTEGTPLIGGWIEGKYTGMHYVHATGKIEAKTWYTSKKKVELKQKVKERTGKEEKKYTISFHNFKINLYKRLSKFENYDTIVTNQNVKIFSDFYLPVGITTCHNFETYEKEVEYTKEEAKQIAIEQAEKELEEQIPEGSEVKNRAITYKEEADYVEVEVTYELIENIGTEEKIVF